MSNLKSGGALKELKVPDECKLTTVVEGKNATDNICAPKDVAIAVIDAALGNSSTVVKKDQSGKKISDEELESEYIKAKEKISKDTDCVKNCEAESTAIAAIINVLPSEKVAKVKEAFAPTGPSGEENEKEWLDNQDIDDTLDNFVKAMAMLKPSVKVLHTNFHMQGFMKDKEDLSDEEISGNNGKFPTELRLIAENFKKDVIDKGYDYFACVLNTDLYSGGGKHWVALLVDIKNKNIEYFDSVGQDPFQDVAEWIVAVRDSVSGGATNKKEWKAWNTPDINKYRHQNENYDCGVFSVYYIIQRILHKEPVKSFHKPDPKLTDAYMRKTVRSQLFSKTKI